MEADPYQTNNLTAEQPELLAKCRQIMDTWVEEQKAKPNFVSDPIDEVLKERGKTR
jgi:hypothetical protein